jgi:hypothetical protein
VCAVLGAWQTWPTHHSGDSFAPAISFISVAPISAAARHGLSCALWLVNLPLKTRASHVVVTFIVFPSSFLVSRAKAALLRLIKLGRVGFARCLCSVRARVCQRFFESRKDADGHVAISSLAFNNLVRLSHCHLCLCCTSSPALSRIRTIQQTIRLQEINIFRKDSFVPPSKRKNLLIAMAALPDMQRGFGKTSPDKPIQWIFPS